MIQISFSGLSKRSTIRLLTIITALTLISCQVICLTHCHGFEHNHIEHHNQTPIWHGGPHHSEHHQTEHEDEGGSFTDLHEHSSIDRSLAPKKLAFRWPEIAADIATIPAINIATLELQSAFTDRDVSLLDKYGFIFVGRSPTAS